jgi:hypothetical protein
MRIEFDASSMRVPSQSALTHLATASEMNLRYGYFETDVSISSKDFGVEQLHAIPILDFIFCLIYASLDVRRGITGEITFTENDQSITMIPQGDSIIIRRSWAEDDGRASTDDFTRSAKRFCIEALNAILDRYPTFAENATYAKLMEALTEVR